MSGLSLFNVDGILLKIIPKQGSSSSRYMCIAVSLILFHLLQLYNFVKKCGNM